MSNVTISSGGHNADTFGAGSRGRPQGKRKCLTVMGSSITGSPSSLDMTEEHSQDDDCFEVETPRSGTKHEENRGSDNSKSSELEFRRGNLPSSQTAEPKASLTKGSGNALTAACGIVALASSKLATMKTVSGQGSPLMESSIDCPVLYASFMYFSESCPESSSEENLANFRDKAQGAINSAKNAVHQSCRSACVSVLEKVAGDAKTKKGAMRDIDDINDVFESQLRLATKEKMPLPLCETELSRLAKLLQQAAFSSRDKPAAESPGDMIPSDGEKSDDSNADMSISLEEFEKSSTSFISNFKSMRKRKLDEKDARNAKKQRKNSASPYHFRHKRVQLSEKLWDLLQDCAQPTCLPDKPAGAWGKSEAKKLDRLFRPYKKEDGTIRKAMEMEPEGNTMPPKKVRKIENEEKIARGRVELEISGFGK